MARIVRTVAMVAEVLESTLDMILSSCPDRQTIAYIGRLRSRERTLETKCQERNNSEVIAATYLLILRLFFFEPKRPWTKTIGLPIALLLFSVGGS